MKNITYYVSPQLTLKILEKEKHNQFVNGKPFSLLKIHFSIIDNILIMQVLEQDPDLAGVGDIVWRMETTNLEDDEPYENPSDFFIASMECPEIDLENHTLFLRGLDEDKDNFKGACSFNDIYGIQEFIDNVKDLLEHSKHLFDYEITVSDSLVSLTDN